MLRIDLVYPVEDRRSAQLRSDLRDALHMLDLPPRWDEHEGPEGRPPYLTALAGPAVVVEGQPVRGADGTPGSRARIVMALQEHLSRRD